MVVAEDRPTNSCDFASEGTNYLNNNSALFMRSSAFFAVNGWCGPMVKMQGCGPCEPGSIPGAGPNTKTLNNSKCINY